MQRVSIRRDYGENGAMPCDTGGAESDRRQRATDLFRYLRAVAELRLRPILDVDNWEQVIWLEALSEPGNCRTCLEEDDLDDWIQVERPRARPDPPPLPRILEPWIDPGEIADWRGAPSLLEQPRVAVASEYADGIEEASNNEHAEDRQAVRDAWARYEDRWVDWAADCEAAEPQHRVYRDFFIAHNRVAQLGEQYEIVVAVGLLNWQLPDRTIRRHLIATPASLTYETDSGLIAVGPASVGDQRPHLEDEMIPAGSHPPGDVVAGIRTALDAAGGPFDESVTSALRQWVLAADESGTFTESLHPNNGARATPELRLAPAVVLRRRRQASLRRTYDEIIGRLDDGGEIPPSVASLVDDTADVYREDSIDQFSPRLPFGESERLFFPLPTNPQQQRIIEELRRRRGVVVQGPPGTGKSHTIANLISHCLATGKRVLVTSHTERALRVVKEKLPEQLRDLTVSVLGAGREGAADLARSANAILDRRGDPNWSVNSLNAQIERWAESLEQAEASREQHRERLGRLRASASASHQLSSGYSGPMGEIAQTLTEEEDAHGWLLDQVSEHMPIRYEELHELRSLANEVRSTDPNLASQHLPSLATLPTAEELQSARDIHEEAHQRLSRLQGDTSTAERLRSSAIDLPHLRELLQNHEDADSAARRRSEPWLDQALTDLDAGRIHRWEDLQQRTSSFLEHDFEHPYDGVKVASIESVRLLPLIEQAGRLMEHLREGRRLTGFRGRRLQVARQNGEALDVAERMELPLGDPSSAQEFGALLEELRAVTQLALHWGDFFESIQGTLAQTRARLRDFRETLDHLTAVSRIRGRVSEVVGQVLTDPVDTAEDVVHLRVALELAEALNMRDRSTSEHDRLMQTLTTAAHARAHPSFRELFRAAQELQVPQYRESLADLERLSRDQQQLERFRILREALATVAPRFAETVIEGASEMPEADALSRAWRWSWAMDDLQRLRVSSEGRLVEQLANAESEVANYTTVLCAVRAWRNTLAGLTAYEAQELRAYQQALRRLGRGRGRRAAEYRRDAELHLGNCQTAVRAWIMPTYRVAETLRATPESFDLVIVDEASQSGVDALFLLWLGKQVVIVGDDNQISPSNVGVHAEDADALRNQYLGSLGLQDLLGVDNSLFDQAKVRFSGEVWLTEHFRCMPEIIEFSNQLLYVPQNRRLEPLRQFGSERLPPLKRRHVPHGQQQGSSGRTINRAEASALVEQLIACHNDSWYDGLTFGVIGLLRGQARYIESLLFERLPTEAWEERQLRCGDAYDFQGDERDVIFLSMVRSLDPSRSRIPALGNRSDEQRYNVAASRARDQMWLFHSMTIEELNPRCVRFALLNHFQQPPDHEVAPFDEPVARDARHPVFDSLFEQRVFLDICDRGYVVRPQIEAYGYRIDLVVFGSQRKLAVECDGAEWHGPARYAEDLERQRNLERAGWTFFRVRDIDYYLDPSDALEPLWHRLRDLDIHPRGMGTRQASVARSSPVQQVQSLATSPISEPIRPLRGLDEESDNPPEPSAAEPPPTQDCVNGGATEEERPDTDPPPPARSQAEPPADRQGAAMERLGHLLDLPDSPHGHSRPPQPSGVTLDPYTAWERRPIERPENLHPNELIELIVEIVGVEGPVVADRVFEVIGSTAGIQSLGRRSISAIRDAQRQAVSQGRIVQTDPLRLGGTDYATLRTANQGLVHARERGPRRRFRHIPAEELAAVLEDARSRTSSVEESYRTVLSQYGMRQLTHQVRTHLQRCEAILAPEADEQDVDPGQGCGA